jgi:hypothetical protein
MYTQIKPDIEPIVWLPVNRYPVAEPWATGNDNYVEYVAKRAVKGIIKNPAKPAITPSSG